jgi:hypothetical protein
MNNWCCTGSCSSEGCPSLHRSPMSDGPDCHIRNHTRESYSKMSGSSQRHSRLNSVCLLCEKKNACPVKTCPEFWADRFEISFICLRSEADFCIPETICVCFQTDFSTSGTRCCKIRSYHRIDQGVSRKHHSPHTENYAAS